MDGLLFGSIGVIADISDVQREAFNEAFAKSGLDWCWEREEYFERIKSSGGRNRIRDYAKERGEELSEDQITDLHLSKTRIFNTRMVEDGLRPRPGVLRLLRQAREAGMATALVTSSSQANVDALISALGATITPELFDLITTRDMVENSKPASDIYDHAVQTLGLSRAVAIEDSASALAAARAAHIPCIVTPGEAHVGGEFPDAAAVFDHLGDPENGLDQPALPDGFVTLDFLREFA